MLRKEVTPRPPSVYSQAELTEMVQRMREVSNTFYFGARSTNCHTFIEFTGLINKYIDVCERAAREGHDFTATSIHGDGSALLTENHDVQYLAEKFACIFARSMLAQPKIWHSFRDAVEAEIGVSVHAKKRAIRSRKTSRRSKKAA